MTRLWDRVLARQGYNEHMFSGAYYVTSMDINGRGKEGTVTGLVRTAREAYASNGIVAACAAVRMALLSEARFCFQAATDGHTFTNQDLAVVQHPWPNASEGELLARMEQDGGTTAGNAYIRLAQTGDGPQLVQMRPDTVTIVTEEVTDDRGRTFRRPRGYVEDLRVLGVDRDPQSFTPAEVAHFSPVPDPQASFRGMSWLTPVLREVGADQALTSYKTEHLSNGAFPGLVLKYSQKLSDTTVETLRKRVNARYGGVGNAGKTLVLDEGGDPMVAGSTLEQLQFDTVTRAGERRIAAAAQVPLEILGLETGDYQSAVRRFADLWARPQWRMICAALEHLVPTSADIGPVRLWYDVAGIAALREGELQRAQALLVKSQGFAAMVNAGATFDSAVQAADAGDISLLKKDPNAVPGLQSGRPPQAAIPEDLPGVVKPNLPNSRPWTAPPMPGMPNGARG